jgi:hypothetical protein
VRRVMIIFAALILPLAAITAGGVAAAGPAAAQSLLIANPSIAIDGGGDQYIFWQGTNGGLWEAYNTGSWKGPLNIGQMGALGSAPAVAVNQGIQYVVWQGENAHLWLGYWNGSSWVGPCSLPEGVIGSAPDISLSSGGELDVVWEGTNGALWYAYSSNSPSCSGWSGAISLGDGTLGSAPSVSMYTGSLDAIWTGTSPQNDMYYLAGPPNNSLYNVGDGPLGSQPSLVDEPDNIKYGFWAGQDGGLWTGGFKYQTGTFTNEGHAELTQTDGASLGPLGSAPSAAFGAGGYYVVWQGENNGLWEATCNPLGNNCWTLTQIPGMGPL